MAPAAYPFTGSSTDSLREQSTNRTRLAGSRWQNPHTQGENHLHRVGTRLNQYSNDRIQNSFTPLSDVVNETTLLQTWNFCSYFSYQLPTRPRKFGSSPCQPQSCTESWLLGILIFHSENPSPQPYQGNHIRLEMHPPPSKTNEFSLPATSLLGRSCFAW